jgi:hypothetical protein
MATHDTRTGGCQCGAIRYEVPREPLALFACHCTECRKQSASAFGLSFIVPRAALRVVQGTPRAWSRPTDSGNTLECLFCPDCGTRVWHQRRGDHPTLSIKGGSLDEPVDFARATHIWTASRLPGVVVPPDAPQFPGEPDRY